MVVSGMKKNTAPHRRKNRFPPGSKADNMAPPPISMKIEQKAMVKIFDVA